MNKKFSLSLLLLATVLLSSCQKDETIPQTDYSIESDISFELISQHSNGWIKEAQYNNFHLEETVPQNEFEYYENGYIKSAKVYSKTTSPSGLNTTLLKVTFGLKLCIKTGSLQQKRFIAKKELLCIPTPMVT